MTAAKPLAANYAAWASRDDPQDKAMSATLQAAAAVARDDRATALREATTALTLSEAFGLRTDAVRWSWAVAADAALALGQLDAATDLAAQIDRHPIGHQPPLLRAERARIEARLLAAKGNEQAAAAFAVAVRKLRDLPYPYHLALGLLDHAEFLAGEGSVQASRELADEAREIGERLGAQPLVDRALRLSQAVQLSAHE